MQSRHCSRYFRKSSTTLLCRGTRQILLDTLSCSRSLDVKPKDWTSIRDLFVILSKDAAPKRSEAETVGVTLSGYKEILLIGFKATSSTYFADALTRLFEHIAVIIDQHQPLVEAHYGRGKMLRVIQRLQEESDVESGIILDKFVQTRQIEAKLVEIQSLNIAKIRSSTANWSAGAPVSSSHTPKPVAESANSQLVDPRQLDQNLVELALVSQRSALFHRFIHDRADDEMEYIGSDESTQGLILQGKDKRFYGDNGLLVSSALAKRTRELLNSYLVIDEYLLKRNIDKVKKKKKRN